MKAATALFLLLGPALAAAQDLRLGGHAGFGARAVRGMPAPVTVEIDNRAGPDREIELEITWGLEGLQQPPRPTATTLRGRRGPIVRIPVTLSAHGKKIVSTSMIAPDGDGLSAWAFAIDRNGSSVAESELLVRFIPQGSRLVAIVGSDKPSGLDLPGLERTWVRAEHLPEDWRAYQALESLVWLDAVVSDLRGPASLAAMQTWVSNGGHLLVARSNSAGLEKSPLADLLPVSLQGTGTVPAVDFAGLSGGAVRLDKEIAVLRSRPLGARVRLAAVGVPLVVEALRDLGRVTFVAFDPARPPFQEWDRIRSFWAWLLDVAPADTATEIQGGIPPAWIGSATLLRQAARFPDVPTPQVGGLFLLIVLYLIAVGPGDYLVLRRLKRLELTWITFPALVLVFTVLILLLGGGFMKRSGLQREIAVVDRFPDHVRRRTLDGVLSPVETVYRTADALPICANFLAGGISSDYSEELNDVRIARLSSDRVSGWALNRGATGLLFSDRTTAEASPLSWTILDSDRDSLHLEIRNDTGRAIPPSALLAPTGVYLLDAVPRGTTRISSLRRWPDAFTYAANEGLPPRRAADERRYARHYSYTRSLTDFEDVPESQLNAEARRLFVALSLPRPTPEPSDEPVTGLARDLSARRWIEAGGSILLTWESAEEPLVSVEPRPAKRTAFVFTRTYEGPRP